MVVSGIPQLSMGAVGTGCLLTIRAATCTDQDPTLSLVVQYLALFQALPFDIYVYIYIYIYIYTGIQTHIHVCTCTCEYLAHRVLSYTSLLTVIHPLCRQGSVDPGQIINGHPAKVLASSGLNHQYIAATLYQLLTP